MPRVARSSRLPVGSSAMSTNGSFTSARANATRCCSPPDSSLGSAVDLDAEPDLRERARHLARNARRRRPDHLERERDVLLGGSVLEQAEVLEDDAESAPQLRDVALLDVVGVVAADAHLAAGRALVHVQQLEDACSCRRRWAR